MSNEERNLDGDLEKTDFTEEIGEDEQSSFEEFTDDMPGYEDEAEDIEPSFADELENYLPTPENTDKVKKPLPVWCVALLTSLLTCVVILTIYTLLIMPRVKPQAIISYVNGNNGAKKTEELTGVGQIAENVLPAVVSISGKTEYRSFFGVSTQAFSGSGIVISENGYILTCYSLIGGDGDITVKTNDNSYTATLVGGDPKKDIAIIKIDAEGLKCAALENSDSVKTGDNVIAMANMLGGNIGVSVTKGIVCGVNSGISLSNGNSINLIQTDALSGQNCAGGCLLNEKGNVIGMLTASISSGSDKIGLAIPSADIINVSESVISTGLAPSGLIIGITGNDNEHGVTVDSVNDNSPAEKAGIKQGDLILKVDGTTVKSVSEINRIRDTHKKGDTIVITVYRDGEVIDIDVKL